MNSNAKNPSVNNIVELRTELLGVFDGIKTGEVSLATAKELTNTAGKIINSVKVQLEYAFLRKETPLIEFIGGDQPSKPQIAAKIVE